MKLLTKSKEIEKAFKQLINNYSEFYWGTAWAGVDFICFEELKKNKAKIKKIIVGTSFDHTHPEFIREFQRNRSVRFNREGELFHLKIYLFQNNSKDWAILLGSMNFTMAGFSKNVEALIFITNKDDGGTTIYNNAIDLINENWEKGRYFSDNDLEEYEKDYSNQVRRSGKYGDNKPGKPINRSKIMNMPWQDYVDGVKKEKEHTTEGRLLVLTTASVLSHKSIDI